MKFHQQARGAGFRPLLGLTVILATLSLLTGCPVTPTDTADPRLQLRAVEHVMGDADASVVVIEYGDFQCPVCGRFFDETLPTIQAEYVDTGRVAWVFRHFPLTQVHANAEAASRAAECAGRQGQFFAYHDLLFQNQTALGDTDLRNYADMLGLDLDDFDACVASADIAAAVDADVADGTALGVTGTPTFFINGERVAGFRTVEQMRALLDAALAAEK
jgi:protein-disulfide isomerase